MRNKNSGLYVFLFLLGAVSLSAFYYTLTANIVSHGYQQYSVSNRFSELNSTERLGYNFTNSSFSCGSSSYCVLVQVAACDNNLPSQFACINTQAYPEYTIQRSNMGRDAICPMFMVAGTHTCECASGYCTEISTGT